MRAYLRAGFQQAGTQPLARQFEQAEITDPTDLQARPVGLHRLTQATFNLANVPAIFHVDKIDHDQTGQVTKAQLAADFVCGLNIRLECRFFDIALFGRFAGVHIDRDQCFGRVDDNVAAGFKLNLGVVHRVELLLDLKALIQRDRIVPVLLNPFGMAWHHQAHKAFGCLISLSAFDLNFLDVLAVNIANGAFNDIAFFVHHCGCRGFKGLFAHFVPCPDEIFEIAFYFGLVSLKPRGPDDDSHALGHIEGVQCIAQFTPFLGDRDLARNSSATGRVRHQDAITSCEGNVGRQCGALVATFFLDHLDQQDLAALDDFLDLVAAHGTRATR